jgi:hypothetical protein
MRAEVNIVGEQRTPLTSYRLYEDCRSIVVIVVCVFASRQCFTSKCRPSLSFYSRTTYNYKACIINRLQRVLNIDYYY